MAKIKRTGGRATWTFVAVGLMAVIRVCAHDATRHDYNTDIPSLHIDPAAFEYHPPPDLSQLMNTRMRYPLPLGDDTAATVQITLLYDSLRALQTSDVVTSDQQLAAAHLETSSIDHDCDGMQIALHDLDAAPPYVPTDADADADIVAAHLAMIHQRVALICPAKPAKPPRHRKPREPT